MTFRPQLRSWSQCRLPLYSWYTRTEALFVEAEGGRLPALYKRYDGSHDNLACQKQQAHEGNIFATSQKFQEQTDCLNCPRFLALSLGCSPLPYSRVTKSCCFQSAPSFLVPHPHKPGNTHSLCARLCDGYSVSLRGSAVQDKGLSTFTIQYGIH